MLEIDPTETSAALGYKEVRRREGGHDEDGGKIRWNLTDYFTFGKIRQKWMEKFTKLCIEVNASHCLD